MLTLTEAADQLGLSASTLRHQVQAGRLRARLVGKTYVVTDREVERYRREHLGRAGRPSQGRKCKTHWNQYTAGLGRDAKALKAAASGTATEAAPTESKPEAKPGPIRTRVPRGRRSAVPEAGSQGDAG